MLRSDTTTLFERLREANILLQEVLSGAHENMSAIENTLVTRVSEFVSTMNEVSERSGVDQQPGRPAHQLVPRRHQQGAGRSRPARHAVRRRTAARWPRRSSLIDKSNRRTDETLGERRAAIETLVATLDTRTDDIEQRLKRFSSLLDESLDGATGRAREIARIIAESSSEGARALEEERRRASELLHGIYTQHSGETQEMFQQTTQRFTETLQGMKQMAAEMQRELETTRSELRRGILELPQETADSAAQMRRVIVDQIEALAELNRIVARHGRGLDAAEPRAAAAGAGARRRAGATPSRRAWSRRRAWTRRGSRRRAPTSPASAPMPPRRADSPSLSPGQASRQRPQRLALRAPAPRLAPGASPARRAGAAPRADDRPPRHTHRVARTRCRSTSRA